MYNNTQFMSQYIDEIKRFWSSADGCVQPETPESVDCQNNSAMLCLPDPFPPSHRQKKKAVWLRETSITWLLLACAGP